MQPQSLPRGWLSPEDEGLIAPRSLWPNPRDSISHYLRWVWEYLAYLTLVCELQRESSVLDLGCGHGRMALGLLHYLRHPGRYTGFDVDRKQIDSAQQRIGSREPGFEFVWADVYSRETNPAGSERAESVVLPFDDATYDVIFAASLFTHLLPAEARRYFLEARRVLRPGGRILFSFFVLDHYGGSGTTVSPQYEFEHSLPGECGAAVRDPAYPDTAIAYRQHAVEEMAAAAGLVVRRVLPGLWSERPGLAVNEQDLVLLTHA